MEEHETRSWQSAAPPTTPPPPAPVRAEPATPADEEEIIEGEVIAATTGARVVETPPVVEAPVVEAPPAEPLPAPPPEAPFTPEPVKPAGRLDQLPKRRWRLRAPRVFINGVIGALVGGVIPFIAWWLSYLPAQALWIVLIPMVLGWVVLMPRPVYLAMDKQGVALISKGWLRTSYLWVPQDRMLSLSKNRGWLLAMGTDNQHEGHPDWQYFARQAGAQANNIAVNTFAQMAAGGSLVAAPLFLLDELSRDEVELWIYQQGRF